MDAYIWCYISVVSVILVFAVVSNILVILSVLIFKKRRQSVTNLLICNLAASDLLLDAFLMPQKLHDTSHTEEDYFEGECLIYTDL